MGELAKKDNNSTVKPTKKETYAGKHTARVTEIYKQSDGTVVKKTIKINKNGSISRKLEHIQK